MRLRKGQKRNSRDRRRARLRAWVYRQVYGASGLYKPTTATEVIMLHEAFEERLLQRAWKATYNHMMGEFLASRTRNQPGKTGMHGPRIPGVPPREGGD